MFFKKNKGEITLRNRNKQVHFYLTDDELSALDQKVKKTNLTREAYIRSVLFDTIPVETPPIAFFDLYRELNGIGNNLNQLAAKAHTLGFINQKDYQEDAAKLNYVLDLMLESLAPRKR